MMEYTNDFSRGRGFLRRARVIRGSGSVLRGRGSSRGGRPIVRGTRGGYSGVASWVQGYGYQDGSMQAEPQKDKCVIYLNFPGAITDKGVAELMEFGKTTTTMHFGWKCCITYESEAKAIEMETKLAEMEFNGQKPNIDSSHRKTIASEPAKRNSSGETEISPAKKKKVEDGSSAEKVDEDASEKMDEDKAKYEDDEVEMVEASGDNCEEVDAKHNVNVKGNEKHDQENERMEMESGDVEAGAE